MENQSNSPFDTFAIVELFGHTRIAGRVTEQVIAGQGYIRVDVPAFPENGYHPAMPGFTRLYGPGAIYSMTPVSEEIAFHAAVHMCVAPVSVYLGLPALESGEDDLDEDDMEQEQRSIR